MEFYGKKKTFWSFIEEDQRSLQCSPTHCHQAESEQSRASLSRPSSATVVSLSPSSPGGSPWILSPLRRPSSSSPSLLYHCLATLQRQDGNVLSIAISNGLVFTGSESDRVRLWKQPECIDRGLIRTGHGRIQAMLAHGNTLFTAHKDHRLRVWSIINSSDKLQSKKLATLPPTKTSFFPFPRKQSQRHQDAITCLAFYHAEGLFYSGSLDKTVKAWKLSASGHCCVDSFTAHDARINAMVINQRDGCLFTSSSDGSVKIWRRVYGDYSHAVILVLRFQSSPVNAVALSPSSCCLYSGSSDGYINIWDKEEVVGARYRHGGFLQGHRFAVLSLEAVGRLIVSGSEDATIRAWRREECGTHVCLAVMEGHRGPVRCLAASVEVEDEEGEGLLLYSASLDRMVKVWRMKVVGREGGDEKEGLGGCEMSPVLSPLWVERRIQGKHLD